MPAQCSDIKSVTTFCIYAFLRLYGAYYNSALPLMIPSNQYPFPLSKQTRMLVNWELTALR